MSDRESHGSLLSREELGALLEEVAAGQKQEAQRRWMRPSGLEEAVGSRAELMRVAERFSEDQSRALSTLFQTPIHFRFQHWEETALREFASGMVETDRVVRLELGEEKAPAYLLINRSMFFSWLVLAFGAGAEAGNDLIPGRPYTRIEERFMIRCADEVSSVLAKSLALVAPMASRAVALETPMALMEGNARQHLVLSFEVQGLAELAMLRVALPAIVVDQASSHGQPSEEEGGLERQVFDMPVELRVELGTAQVPIGRLRGLAVGDEIPLVRSDPDGVLVQVEGAAKYRADQGTMGDRLAVRIREVL